MDLEVKKENPTIFELAERKDELQINNFDSSLKEAYVYEIQGKPVLSYVGLKHAVILMAQGGNPLSVVSEKTELIKPDDDKLTWFWDSTIVVKNSKTGLETMGNASATLYKGNIMQEFSKRTAMSKAERNAQRKQLPEQLLANLINDVRGENVSVAQQVRGTKSDEKTCDGKHDKCQKAGKTLSSGVCLHCGLVRKESGQ